MAFSFSALPIPREASSPRGWLKAYRRDPTGGSGTTLGDELDARVNLILWNHLDLMAGYGRFFPGGFVKATDASAPANCFAQAAYSW
jgi:hypothetical protein